METPLHENRSGRGARQALASISKAGAAGSSARPAAMGLWPSAQVREVPEGLGTLSGAGAQWCPLGSPGQGRSEDAPRALEWGCLVCLLEESKAT